MKIRNKTTPAVYLFLEKDGQVLLGRRRNTGYLDGYYQVPAGHVEEGELPTEALIREAKEEVGIDLTNNDIELAHVSYRPKHDETGDRVDFFFKAKKWSGEVTNVEPDKCDDLNWFPFIALPEKMPLHVRRGIHAILTGIFFEEINLESLKKEGLYLL